LIPEVISGVYYSTWDLVNKYKKPKLEVVVKNKGPGTLSLMWKSWKEKTCVHLTFNN
jgi:hypothetical protein